MNDTNLEEGHHHLSSTANILTAPRTLKWSNKFIQKNEVFQRNIEIQRKLKNEDRRSYHLKALNTDLFKICNFVGKEADITPISFKENGSARRCKTCIICSENVSFEREIGCDLCPCVVHRICLESSTLHGFLKNSAEKAISDLDKKGNKWWCPHCHFEVKGYLHFDRKRINLAEQQKLECFSILKLQARFLMYKEKRRYGIARHGILKLQAKIRAISGRIKFGKELERTHRPYRIKVCDYSNLSHAPIGMRSNISCIVCVLNNYLDESETQLYRFDSQTPQHDRKSGRWNDIFTVYSSSPQVKFSFTVYDKDELTLKSVFLGQSVVDANNQLQKAFVSGTYKYKVDLGPLQIDPRDQVSKVVFRMDGTEIQDVSGRILFDIIPFSNVDSKCGVLEEILRGSRKRWCAVLADKQLNLFSQFGDTRPKVTISLSVQCGTSITWHDKEIIKVSTCIQSCTQNYFFTCKNPKQRIAWYNRMTGIYRDLLATTKGVSRNAVAAKKKIELKK